MRISTLLYATILVSGLCFVVGAPAHGDSIYLKNGRVIHSDDVRVDDDRVVFRQLGGYQSIPLALVERIEEDSRVGPTSVRPPTPEPAGGDLPDAGIASPLGADPAVALQQLSGLMSESAGGVDPAQAMQLLQALGTQEDGSAGGGAAALLGLLGGGGGDGIGATGADLEQLQAVLPALTRLSSALFAAEYDAATTEAAALDLMRVLENMGVSRAEIRARAAQMGVPAEILDKIRTP